MPSPKLTPEVQHNIVAFLRAGGFPEVASEAAGVPQAVFESWVMRGEAPRARSPYREFAVAVRQAIAQARLGAEVEARNDRPLDWLRSGPGKERPHRPGWSGPARRARGPTPARRCWSIPRCGSCAPTCWRRWSRSRRRGPRPPRRWTADDHPENDADFPRLSAISRVV